MAMKPRCPRGMGVVLERPVAIVFALDAVRIADNPGLRNTKSAGCARFPAADEASVRHVEPALAGRRAEHFTRFAGLASGSEVPQYPHPSVKRFSSEARTLQWLDRRVGAPVCMALTLARRLGDLARGSRRAGGEGSILFLKLAEQGSTVLAH